MKSKIQSLQGKWVDIQYHGKVYKKQQAGIIMETSENYFVFEASEVKPHVITYDKVINVEEIK